MKKLLSVFVTLVLIMSFFSLTSLAQEGQKEQVISEESIIHEYKVNGNTVKVKISKENNQKISPKVLKGLADEFGNATTIHVYRVGDRKGTDTTFTPQKPKPNHHKESQNKNGEISTNDTQCSYYGLCTEHSHYVVNQKQVLIIEDPLTSL